MDSHAFTPRALELARQRLDEALEGRPNDIQLLLLRARADERVGRYTEAVGFFERAAHLARRTRDRDREGRAQLDCGTAMSRAGFDAEALEAYRRAIVCFDLADDALQGIEARQALIRHELAYRRFDAARQQLVRMLPLVEAHGDDATQRWTHEQLVQIYRRQGQLPEALEHARTCVRMAAHAGDPALFGNHLTQLGSLHEAMGNRVKAAGYLTKALPYLRQRPRRQLFDTLLTLAGLTTEPATEVALLEEAIEVAAHGSVRDQGRARVRLAHAVIDEDPKRAQSLLGEAVALLREAGDPEGSAPAWLTLAQLQARHGEADEARVSQRRARDLFAMVGDAEGEARAAQVLEMI